MTTLADVGVPPVGSPAPQFVLKDQNNEEFSLAEHRDGAEPAFHTDDLITVTISCDTVYAHKIFAEREGFEHPLLSDFWPHGAVSRAYGVFNDEGGFANRGTFLIDRDGVVRFTELNGPGRGRDPQVWRDAVAAL